MSAERAYIGTTAIGVNVRGVLPVFRMPTMVTSASGNSSGTKIVISEARGKSFAVRFNVCHIKPAKSSDSPASPVKRSASSPAEAPVKEQALPSPNRHQKFLVLRLLCKFSALTGSYKKVFWSFFASPPSSGVRQERIPSSPATGKYR